MLIRCPTCASGYDLPPHLLSAGRILRCAECRDAWVHDAARGGPAIAVEARSSRREIPMEPSRPLPRAPRTPRQRPGGGATVAAAAVLMLAAGMATVGERERVVAAVRPSAAVFAALGLPVNLRGLALADVRSSVATVDGASTLTLDGAIANVRSRPTAVPTIRIAVRDAAEREIYAWTAPAPKARLAAGETVPFHARLSAPPREGATLAVSFADASPAAGRQVAEASRAGW